MFLLSITTGHPQILYVRIKACHWVLLTFLKVSFLHVALGNRETFSLVMFQYPTVRCFTVSFCFFAIPKNLSSNFNLYHSTESISINNFSLKLHLLIHDLKCEYCKLKCTHYLTLMFPSKDNNFVYGNHMGFFSCEFGNVWSRKDWINLSLLV